MVYVTPRAMVSFLQIVSTKLKHMHSSTFLKKFC